MAVLPAGLAVWVTRPVEQAGPLCRMVEEAGGDAIAVPLLDIAALQSEAPGPSKLRDLGGVDWLVFVSVNAVRCAWPWLGPQCLQGKYPKIAAIGQATALALAERGVAVDLRPKQQFNSEALLAQAEWENVQGQHFLIVRGEGGRELLAQTLSSRGARVEYAEVYRRVCPDLKASGILARWQAGGVDVICITSGEALENLGKLLEQAEGGRELLMRTHLVVIGERQAKRAQELGCTHVVAAEASDLNLFDAVVRIGQEFFNTHQPRG